MSPEVIWLTQAKEHYKKSQPDSPVRVETNFGRANQSIKVLQEKILPLNHKPNILIVGVGNKGGDNNPLVCSYSPFVMSAFLEAQGVDFRMSLVDIADTVISDVKTRENLYLTSEYIHEFSGSEEDWRNYLNWTKQTERILHEGEEGLVFGYTDSLFPPEFYLKQGIHAAEVPQGFKEKRKKGEIILIEDDIAVADLGVNRYDFVELTNVLYHLPTEGQMLAIANIAGSLNEGGLVLVNDIGELAGIPLFAQVGGWLNEEMLSQVYLVVDEITIHEEEVEQPRSSYKANIVWATLRKMAA